MRYYYIYYPAVQEVTACEREALAAVAVKGARVGKGAQSGVTGGRYHREFLRLSQIAAHVRQNSLLKDNQV